MNGHELIQKERQRQIEVIGYTKYEDSQKYSPGTLLAAAECYYKEHDSNPNVIPQDWPWGSDYWKPSKDRVRELTKAGALYLAEFDLSCNTYAKAMAGNCAAEIDKYSL